MGPYKYSRKDEAIKWQWQTRTSCLAFNLNKLIISSSPNNIKI